MLASVGVGRHSGMLPFVDFKSRPVGNVLFVLYLRYCTVCSVPTVLFVLYLLYCTVCSVPTVLYYLFCTYCTVLFVLYLMYCIICSVPTALPCYIQQISVVVYQAPAAGKVLHFPLISSLASWKTGRDGPLKGALK